RGSREALAELLGPSLDGARSMLEDKMLSLVLAGNPKADVVLLVGPVDADEGGEGGLFWLVHVQTSRNVGERDMPSRNPTKAIRRAGGGAVPEDSLRASVHPPVRT